MINSISTSVSGLLASSQKLAVSATNIANADVVGSTDPTSPNQAYAAQTTQNVSTEGGVKTISLNRTPAFTPSFEPESPFADDNGLVNAPNVNLDEELINSKIAENAYKANVAVLKTSVEMQDTLRDALDHKS